MDEQGQSGGFPPPPFPLLGRVLWYYPGMTFRGAPQGAPPPAGQPLAAFNARTNGDGTMNLMVIDIEGNAFGVMNVPFRTDMTAPPPEHHYAVWPAKVKVV